jgi:anti-sigma B factor antagonist
MSLALLVSVAVAVGRVATVRAAASAAADLAALAAASSSCQQGENVARANGADTVVCSTHGADAEVTVGIDVEVLPGRKVTVRALARAGPVDGPSAHGPGLSGRVAYARAGGAMHVRVTTQRVRDATVVRACGEVDLHTAPDLRGPLDEAVAAAVSLIVVDLTGVDFMDSTGLSVIVAAVADAREYGGELRVAAAAGKITKLFTLTGVDREVGLYPSVDAALA